MDLTTHTQESFQVSLQGKLWHSITHVSLGNMEWLFNSPSDLTRSICLFPLVSRNQFFKELISIFQNLSSVLVWKKQKWLMVTLKGKIKRKGLMKRHQHLLHGNAYNNSITEIKESFISG